MHVLLIKLSSMGDIIHTLPAITDAMKFIPALKITWVVEPGFAEIAHWHPAVVDVITMPLRKGTRKQVMQAISQIRAKEYDMVIDAQGLIKSAVLSRLVRGKRRVGLDWTSAREAPASMFYKQKYNVSWQQHAVIRLRKLFSEAFVYPLDLSRVDYGVEWNTITQPNVSTDPYIMFLHGTTWESKHWPDEYWFKLADLVAEQGYSVQVTWATEQQKARAQALADKCPNVIMLPHLTLNQAVTVLHHASGVVAVDTGFAHLSAALDKPLVGIYGPTDVMHSGTVGNRNINLSSKFACAPCEKKTCLYVGEKSVNPPCFQEISPALVWQKLQTVLAPIKSKRFEVAL